MTVVSVAWPYPEVPGPGDPVRFGRRVIGRVSAVHASPDGVVLDLDLNDDVELGIVPAPGELSLPSPPDRPPFR